MSDDDATAEHAPLPVFRVRVRFSPAIVRCMLPASEWPGLTFDTGGTPNSCLIVTHDQATHDRLRARFERTESVY